MENQSLLYWGICLFCAAGGMHAYSEHVLESERAMSARKFVYLIYAVLLGILSVLGFCLAALSLGFVDTSVSSPGCILLSSMLILAYLITALSKLFFRS